MYCTHCGNALVSDARFCPSCGTPIGSEQQPADTTASIDPVTLETPDGVEDLPVLAPGTGMLVVVRGPSIGGRFFLDRDVTTIGRHQDADLLLDDVTVSRHHAEVRRDDDGMVLHDLGSMNGTYVDGERVEQHRLASNDEVQIGRFKLVYFGATPA